MEKEKSYVELIAEVSASVDKDKGAYKSLTPKRKIENLARQIRLYIEKRDSATRYRNLELKYPRYKKYKEESEFFELLSSTRLKKYLDISDDYELDLYVVHLKSKVEELKIEPDLNKRMYLYDYICVGCSHCKVNNEHIMNQIMEIKELASQIIHESPVM